MELDRNPELASRFQVDTTEIAKARYHRCGLCHSSIHVVISRSASRRAESPLFRAHRDTFLVALRLYQGAHETWLSTLTLEACTLTIAECHIVSNPRDLDLL